MSTKTPTLTIKITQQSLNLVRQIIAGAGWAKTVTDIYIGGKMLADGGLPELSPIDWVKTPEQISQMTPEQRASYQNQDKIWADTQIELSLSGAQIAVFTKAFEFFCKEGNFSPNKYFVEIITAFGIKTDSD